jgi:signal transduction histidine kinase
VPDQQVTLLTDRQVFQVQFPLVLTSLACWLLALIVLLAQPRAEANGALAGLFFLLALAIISIHHHVDWLGSNVFTAFTTYIAISLVGATAFHVALTFPQPLVRFPWLRFVAYPLALFSLWLHLSTVFSIPLGPLASLNASVAPFVIDGTLWFVAFPICIGRLLWILRSGCSAKTAAQVRIILVSWVIGMLPPVLATAIYLISLRWVLPGTTLITFVFFLPIAIAGSAYAMLRYQTFAYRGGVLSGLMLVFVSTALACAMMLILALTMHVIDGVQFVIIWASVLAATLFWYIDTPIRRIFRTHFLRHQDQYQIAYDFAAQSAAAFSAEQSLQIAVLTASDAFQSEWAAAWSGFDSGHLVIVDHGSLRVVAATEAPLALLPAPPKLEQPLGQDGIIGWLWVGQRMTAEPFDDQDGQLLALLSDYLTRMLLFHEQIRRLAEVPMLLIATEDRERRRLGLELHDRALGYLGGLPLMVGRARQLAGPHVPDDLQRIHTWIEHNAAQVANDLRTIILQLNPQDLSGFRFLPALRIMAGRLCDLSAVTISWEITGTWDTLDSTASLHLYRIVEQAITNALQHGQPSVVAIMLTVEAGQQCITIHDNGCGFDLSQPVRTGHVGLESMRERAHLLGATLEIESSPNNGTRLRLCLNDLNVDITRAYHGFEPAAAHPPLQRRRAIAKRRWPVEIFSVSGLIVCVVIATAGILALQTGCSTNSAQQQRVIIRGQDPWIGTGICTKPGQLITIRYISGSWTPNKDSLANNPFVGPEGYASIMGSWTVSKDTPVGELIGRIEGGPIHAIGREQTWMAERAGELHLRMNDGDCGGCYNDNAGSIEVVITIAP